MLYDNPQFVAAVKKIISDSLNPRIESEQTQQDPNDESNNAPIATVTELRTQIPIRVKTKADDSKAERAWNVVKGILEVLGIVAVILYTILANKQWHEMISARHQAQTAIEAADRSAKAAQQSNEDAWVRFRADIRPYMAVRDVGFEAGSHPFVDRALSSYVDTGEIPSLNVGLINVGRSPAVHVRAATLKLIIDETNKASRQAKGWVPIYNTADSMQFPNPTKELMFRSLAFSTYRPMNFWANSLRVK